MKPALTQTIGNNNLKNCNNKYLFCFMPFYQQYMAKHLIKCLIDLSDLNIEGVHKLSLQFQKFTIVLFFKIFSIDLFYSKRKCFKFTLDALVHLYVCTISRTYDIQSIFNFLPCSC